MPESRPLSPHSPGVGTGEAGLLAPCAAVPKSLFLTWLLPCTPTLPAPLRSSVSATEQVRSPCLLERVTGETQDAWAVGQWPEAFLIPSPPTLDQCRAGLPAAPRPTPQPTRWGVQKLERLSGSPGPQSHAPSQRQLTAEGSAPRCRCHCLPAAPGSRPTPQTAFSSGALWEPRWQERRKEQPRGLGGRKREMTEEGGRGER